MQRLLAYGLSGLAYISPDSALRILFRLMCPANKTLSSEERQLEKQAQDVSLDVSGYRLAGYCWVGEGSTVLLIHGAHSRSSRFLKLIEALQERGHRVICYDLPAHGNSGGKSADVIDAIAAVKQVIVKVAAAGPIDTVITHSLGFGLMQAALRQMAVDIPFSRVIAIACPEHFDVVLVSLQKRFCLPAKLLASFRCHLQRNLLCELDEISLFSFVRDFAKPILIIHDQHDPVFPDTPALHQHIRAMPNAELLLTQGLGHSRVVADPSVVQRCTTYIQG